MADKIGLIVGTNRRGAMSYEMALYYQRKLNELGKETILMNLGELPHDFAFSALYDNQGKNSTYNSFQTKVNQSSKIFIFVPEYNGSFPGVLKTFIDGLSYPDSFGDKKIALVGLSNGVLGNAVGLGHLDDILCYIGANTLGLRVKLGEIAKHFDGENLQNVIYEKFINQQIDKFLKF